MARHVASVHGLLVAEFQEVESGKRADRPELAKAISAARVKRAVLVIAKLDRLTRNVAFLANLMDGGVEFVACDNPHATRFTIHILAAVAEHEREMISQRTRAALAALADEYAADVRPFIDAARKAGAVTLGDIARALGARGVRTPGGGSAWTNVQVRRAIDRGTPAP